MQTLSSARQEWSAMRAKASTKIGTASGSSPGPSDDETQQKQPQHGDTAHGIQLHKIQVASARARGDGPRLLHEAWQPFRDLLQRTRPERNMDHAVGASESAIRASAASSAAARHAADDESWGGTRKAVLQQRRCDNQRILARCAAGYTRDKAASFAVIQNTRQVGEV
jgi:hypothetical protein